MERGLTIGHQPVGVTEKLGSAVRAVVGAICPSGHSNALICECHSQDDRKMKHRFKPLVPGASAINLDTCYLPGCFAEVLLVLEY